MTEAELVVICVPLRARLSGQQCKAQQAGGREQCRTCPIAGVSVSTAKIRQYFNNVPPQKKQKPKKEKPPKPAKIPKPPKIRIVKNKSIKKSIDYSALKKCPNCGYHVGPKHRLCGMCESADRMPVAEKEARFLEIKRLRKSGQNLIGRHKNHRGGRKKRNPVQEVVNQ